MRGPGWGSGWTTTATNGIVTIPRVRPKRDPKAEHRKRVAAALGNLVREKIEHDGWADATIPTGQTLDALVGGR